MIDALVAELNKLGYQPAWLPQTGLVPADVYELVRGSGTARLARRGPLHDFLPAVSQLELAKGRSADIEHQQSTKKRIAAAADFLKRALGYLGVSAVPKLDLRFAGGHELTVSFADVTYQRIDPSAIGTVLHDMKTAAIPHEQIEKGRVHIAYEYLYAKTIRVRRADHLAFETSLDGKLGDFIDVGGGVEVGVDSSTTLSFAARGRPAAFAYKAGCLRRNDENTGWELSLGLAWRGRGGDDATPEAPFLPALGVVLESESSPG